MYRWLCFAALSLNLCTCSELDYDNWSFQEYSLFPTLPIAAPWTDNAQCRKDSRMLMQNLSNRTDWAVKMWDSSGKTEFGQLYGNSYQGGNFDECLSVREPIRTQYCGVTVRAYVNESYGERSGGFSGSVWTELLSSRKDTSKFLRDIVKWGLCVPASCQPEDLLENTRRYLSVVNGRMNGTVRYAVEIDKDYCQTENMEELTTGEMGFWVATFVITLAVLAGTALDLQKQETEKTLEESKTKKILLCFSLKRNVKTFLRVPKDQSSLRLRTLSSAKCILMIMIICGHRFALSLTGPIANPQKFEKNFEKLRSALLTQGDVIVDTFFAISGFLTCYLLLPHFTKGYANPFVVIVGRVIRLAPLYYYMIWFHATALTRFGSGPLWPAIKHESDNCKTNWWTNVLFVNNYVNVENGCMPHSWFIPCDFHLFIVAVALLYCIGKNEKIGVSLLGILILASSLIPAVITYVYRIPPMLLLNRECENAMLPSNMFFNKCLSSLTACTLFQVVTIWFPNFSNLDTSFRKGLTWQLLHIPTHSRATIYLMGLMQAYIVTKMKGSKKKIPKMWTLVLLLLSFALCIGPMFYGHYLYYDPTNKYDAFESAAFGSLRKLLFGLGLVLYLKARYFGKLSILNFFDPAAFVCLGKMTFAVYVVHFFTIAGDVAKRRTPYYFDEYDFFLTCCNDVLVCTILGFVLYITIELPVKVVFYRLVVEKHIKKLGIQDTETNNNPT